MSFFFKTAAFNSFLYKRGHEIPRTLSAGHAGRSYKASEFKLKYHGHVQSSGTSHRALVKLIEIYLFS